MGLQLRNYNHPLDHRYTLLPQRCRLVRSRFPFHSGHLATLLRQNLPILALKDCLLPRRPHLRPEQPDMRPLQL